MSYRLQDYLFDLPKERVAQEPVRPRDSSKLMVVLRDPFHWKHTIFRKITGFLSHEHVLVLNETRVVPARLIGKRVKTGGKVELLILSPITENHIAKAIVKSRGKLQKDETIQVEDSIFTLVEKHELGQWVVKFKGKIDLKSFLNRKGLMPLPPYIKRIPEESDRRWYQTIYASKPGAIAAPTAGLHFTKRVLNKLRQKGVNVLSIVLHVGVGTFKPIHTCDIRDHKMEAEYYEIYDDVAEELIKAKERGKKIVACGTTVTRALESWDLGEGPQKGWTELFIYPPYKFKVIDALITNFHLPGGTPILLVSAFLGREKLLTAYKEALEKGYRFFSYGDAMLLL